MITDSFDNSSPAKINVQKNEHAVQVDAAVFTFSQEIEKYVVAHYDCEKVGEFICSNTTESGSAFTEPGWAPRPALRPSRNCPPSWTPEKSFISAERAAWIRKSPEERL